MMVFGGALRCRMYYLFGKVEEVETLRLFSYDWWLEGEVLGIRSA